MKYSCRLIIVLLIPVAAQFGVHYFRAGVKCIGDASVAHWRGELNAIVERDFPRE